ncbi:MAG: diguanylate cyclase [Thermodesulfobacteria bacterium]|nr:diguanylate cyclase [Thermodesulfobacteriota bacterium]
MLVKEIMNGNPVVLPLHASVEELFCLFAKSSVGSIVIVDEKHRPVQIFTLRDLPKILLHNLTKIPVSEVLQKLKKEVGNLITIYSGESFLEALHLMEQYNISHLPVIDETDTLVGIISLKDLIRNVPEFIFIDPLTEVHNRSYLNLISFKIKKLHTIISVLMIDLDRFKNLNDTYGHLVGDQVLRKVARVLRKNVKIGDDVIRFGGEEFLILAYRCGLEDAINLGERLRKAVESLEFKDYPNIKVTVSIGISLYTGKKDLWEVIREADDAMYMAKNKGRNRVEVYPI